MDLVFRISMFLDIVTLRCMFELFVTLRFKLQKTIYGIFVLLYMILQCKSCSYVWHISFGVLLHDIL